MSLNTMQIVVWKTTNNMPGQGHSGELGEPIWTIDSHSQKILDAPNTVTDGGTQINSRESQTQWGATVTQMQGQLEVEKKENYSKEKLPTMNCSSGENVVI